mgnify:CR=1 FL=1
MHSEVNLQKRNFKAVITILMLMLLSLPLAGADLVDINTADFEELQTLPYIGGKRAAAILGSRDATGPFKSTKDLLERELIGKKTFEAIQDKITVQKVILQKDVKPVNITNIHINGLDGKIFILENTKFNTLLSAKIREAKESINIAMYLFKTSDNKNNYATQLANELISAKENGVDVTIILENSSYNQSLNESNSYTLKKLKTAGINIRFDSLERQTHSKLVIIDNLFTFIGSHNFSHSALRINNELSLMIESEEIAAKSLEYFRTIE